MSTLSKTDILKKVYSYCAYQDRSEKQVREKLAALEAPEEWIPDILETVKREKFLDEKRFAISYTRGRFFQKGWGRFKIARGLASHDIDEKITEEAMGEIPIEEYLQAVRDLIVQKRSSLEGQDGPLAMDKTYQFLLSRGFEPDIILTEIKKYDWRGNL